MPPRSFSVFQPVRSHSFVDFGLSGGLEGLRWSKASSLEPAKYADTVVDRSPQLPSLCSIVQMRASTFPDEPFTPPTHKDVRAALTAARSSMLDGGDAISNQHDSDFAVASIPQKELMNFGKDAVNGWLKEWRASCNNSSTLALFDASGTPHLLWTTGSNGQFLMCAPIDIAGTVRDPSSALSASQPAFDSNSMTASKCFTHQRVSDIQVTHRGSFPTYFALFCSETLAIRRLRPILSHPFVSGAVLCSAVELSISSHFQQASNQATVL